MVWRNVRGRSHGLPRADAAQARLAAPDPAFQRRRSDRSGEPGILGKGTAIDLAHLFFDLPGGPQDSLPDRGEGLAAGVVGALRGEYADVLITDERTAAALAKT